MKTNKMYLITEKLLKELVEDSLFAYTFKDYADEKEVQEDINDWAQFYCLDEKNKIEENWTYEDIVPSKIRDYETTNQITKINPLDIY